MILDIKGAYMTNAQTSTISIRMIILEAHPQGSAAISNVKGIQGILNFQLHESPPNYARFQPVVGIIEGVFIITGNIWSILIGHFQNLAEL